MKRTPFLLICLVGLSYTTGNAQSYSSSSPAAAGKQIEIGARYSGITTILRGLDQGVVNEMELAWRAAGAGFDNKEAVLLLFRKCDGSLMVKQQGITNEQKAFSFYWTPSALAILHTHPIASDPRPSKTDRQVADKLGVPIFTMTIRGMYVYDPQSKDTVLVQSGMDWLDASRWK
jgi:hypothetical protein